MIKLLKIVIKISKIKVKNQLKKLTVKIKKMMIVWMKIYSRKAMKPYQKLMTKIQQIY